jgi:hypothetical protein
MGNVVARPLPAGSVLASRSEVVLVQSSSGGLTVRIRAAGERAFDVVFVDVWGYRVLDERDLSEYWPACSAPNGRLFEIESGGWMSQEKSRADFLSAAVVPNLKEFFVAGTDDCVSVLCTAAPTVRPDAL